MSKRDGDVAKTDTTSAIEGVGVVVIGRNEGERLQICLDALERSGVARDRLVYVDSGSSDGSVERVRARGITALAIDPPFTAAKGRNAGFAHLTTAHASSLFSVQFVDGDCEYFPDYLAHAARTLRDDSSIVAVTGVLQERRPHATVYNLLCAIEWAGAIGDLDVFPGNVMVRVDAMNAAGPYNPELIAGEDPELSVRIKKATGGRIVRIDVPMCLHDVDMTHASQWWKRNVRAGHAYAQVSSMYPERGFWKRESRSNWLWGAALPLGAPALVPAAYGVLFWRIYRSARARGLDAHSARVYALFTALGKVPQALGQARFLFNRARGAKSAIIEYRKDAARSPRPSAEES